MPTYIRDLIDLPERVHEGDFVLNLSAGVIHPEETLRDYVVTSQLARCFDNALGFVQSAVDSRTSKAAYLHGSFGAGKSHFMAVLHLLLQHHVRARGIPELQPTVARHAWVEGKRFLLVPYHLIGARSMETALLGGYVDHVRRTHPQAPLPAVYPASEILENARQQRTLLGDERFFAELNRGSRGPGHTPGKWGKLQGGWTAESFERVASLAPLSESLLGRGQSGEGLSAEEQGLIQQGQERSRLIGQLITVFFPAYHGVASVKEEAYVPLDQGLSIISQHARDLGYDAVVLFLDELVLWLASRAADVSFVHREGQKLAKLVESQRPDRPIPIISFVARQRDLRELVGERLTGSEQLNFADALRHWEGRFHTITLEDRNLATIAQKRVLRPRSEASGQILASAFQKLLTVRRDVLDVLCTSSGDQALFEQVYPFTPALIQTLVALSSALQRHRTALKLLLLLLVQQRDTLELGQIIPVGDLWDVLDAREKALTEVLESTFRKARGLYTQKLRPMLRVEHQLVENDDHYLNSQDPLVLRRWQAFRNDERLAKTLLLSALVPEVEALKDLTAARLAALNFGSVISPISGREAQLVLNKVRAWAAQVGELRVGEGNNPTLSLHLTGVDIEGLLSRVQEQDNAGNRQRKVRELVFSELEVVEEDSFIIERTLLWRGTWRTVDVTFGNVRTFSLDSFLNRGDRWRLIIDFPFDEAGKGPADDKARIDAFRTSRAQEPQTLLWLPRFLSNKAQTDLGTLVKLDYLLKGDNFERNATHLAPTERAEARGLIANQRNALHMRVKQHLEAAYGLASPRSDSLDLSFELEESFESLNRMLTPRMPGVGSLKEAMEGVLDQALSAQYPGHPRFGEEVKTPALKKTLEVVQQAARAELNRVPVDRALRKTIEAIAHPLKLGVMAETHFVLGTYWRDLLNRRVQELRQEGATVPLKVSQVRAWLEPDGEQTGLTREVGNLIILSWAEQTNRFFVLHGGVINPSLDKLDDQAELREQRLPPAVDWQKALARGAGLLGIQGSPLLNATNMTAWAREVRETAGRLQAGVSGLPAWLREAGEKLGAGREQVEGWPRLQTAEQAVRLVQVLGDRDDVALVRALAAFAIQGTVEALSRSLMSAGEVVSRLEKADWAILRLARERSGVQGQAGRLLSEELLSALEPDELSCPLGDRLAKAREKALPLLEETPEERAAREDKERREREIQEAIRKAAEADRLERERKQRELEEALARKQRELDREKEKAEAESRRLAEERAKLEQERKRQERLEQERQERERQERERQERERQEQEQREREKQKRQGSSGQKRLLRLSDASGAPVTPAGERVIHSASEVRGVLTEVEALLQRHPGGGVRLVWLVEEE